MIRTEAESNSRRLDGQSRSRRFFGLEYATVRPSIFIMLPVPKFSMWLKPSFLLECSEEGVDELEMRVGVEDDEFDEVEEGRIARRSGFVIFKLPMLFVSQMEWYCCCMTERESPFGWYWRCRKRRFCSCV